MDFIVRLTRQLSIKSSKSNNKHGESHTTTGVVTNGGGPNAPKQLKQYSLKEVAAHCTMDSCWMVVLDKVYDFTDFIEYHPGGYELMLEYAGADATNAFIEKPHTIDATGMLDKYLIGELVEQHRNMHAKTKKPHHASVNHNHYHLKHHHNKNNN